MSVRNSHTGKTARRAARQAVGGSHANLPDPGVTALQMVRVVLDRKSGEDLAAVRSLLPDGTPLDACRVALHLADLAAAVVTSEAATAGVERGPYLDGLIRMRQDGGPGDGG